MQQRSVCHHKSKTIRLSVIIAEASSLSVDIQDNVGHNQEFFVRKVAVFYPHNRNMSRKQLE